MQSQNPLILLTNYVPIAPDRSSGTGRPGYQRLSNLHNIELDSDIWAVKVDGIISVTPLSLDLTACVDLASLETMVAR